MERDKIQSTSKYPTTLIVKGLNPLGIEIAKTLIDQGGYVIIIDELFENADSLLEELESQKLLTILDIAAISNIEDDLRRLDYVFYFSHENKSYLKEISTQEFLQESNYLDTILDLSIKFEAKFLLTTSIKAHQLIIESKGFDLNSQTNQDKANPEYTETEIQRYSENLVLEYHEKMKLDSRIIRLGELLGKGMNPLTEAAYLQLIVAAINGKPVEIQGDGLDTDFYLHYIDAARGLIKAMFSLNTKGKVFSLAIPEEISILSIAYKIIELEPNAGEIKFVDYERSLPPLRLYKPAPNLSVLGWEHKIALDRSLAQTIEFIKEREAEVVSKKESEQSKSKSYINEGLEDKVPDEPHADGALARLISERKLHEQTRIGSVVLANDNLRKKFKKDHDKTAVSKISKKSFWVFENVKRKFIFLKNITLREFIFYLILIFIFILSYIYILSPILNISGNVLSIYLNLKDINSQIDNREYNVVNNNLSKVTNDIKDIQERLEDINFLFTITGQGNRYTNYQNSLQIQQDFLDGLQNSYKSIAPLDNYFKSENSKLILRSSSDSLVDIQPGQTTLKTSDVENNYSSLRYGIEKLRVTKDEVTESTNIYPSFVKSKFTPFLNDLYTKTSTLENVYKYYEYIPPLTGLDGKTTYLIIVQDNTRYTSGGGVYSAFVILSIENGILTNVRVNTFDAITAKQITLSDTELEELNLVSSEDYSSNTVDISDTAYIQDLELRSEIMDRSFEEIFGQNIDMTIWLNLSSLKELLKDTEINIQNVQLNSENLLNNIELISGEEINQRNSTIAQISANLITNIVNDNIIIEEITKLSSANNKKDISLYTDNYQLKPLVEEFSSKIQTQSDYLNFGLNSHIDSAISKYPSITISGVINISTNEIKKDITMSVSGLDNLSSAWICTPAGSKDFVIDNIDPSYLSKNFSQNTVCQLYLNDDVSSFPLKNTLIRFENTNNSGYNYSLYIIKPFGIEVEYNLEFIFDTPDSIIPETTPSIVKTNRYIYSGKLEKDLFFRFLKQ